MRSISLRHRQLYALSQALKVSSGTSSKVRARTRTLFGIYMHALYYTDHYYCCPHIPRRFTRRRLSCCSGRALPHSNRLILHAPQRCCAQSPWDRWRLLCYKALLHPAYCIYWALFTSSRARRQLLNITSAQPCNWPGQGRPASTWHWARRSSTAHTP